MKCLYCTNYPSQHTIPKDKTLFELQAELGSLPARNNDFLRQNAFLLGSIASWRNYSLDVFWACMDIFESTGINYFTDYYDIVYYSHSEWNFSKGIEAWFSTPRMQGDYPSVAEFTYLVDCLRFFNIGTYYDIPFPEFEKYASKAYALYYAAEDARKVASDAKSVANKQEKIDRYFNFDNYVEAEFSVLAEKLILNQKTGTSIDEVLTYSKVYPKDTYIVVLKQGKSICYIGKTTSPLQTIATHHKKLMADSACINAIDPLYADDLVLHLKLFYGHVSERAVIYAGNRKYGTLKKASFAYNRGEGISRKKIMAAIERERVRTYELTNGMIIVDKLELHRALFPTTK